MGSVHVEPAQEDGRRPVALGAFQTKNPGVYNPLLRNPDLVAVLDRVHGVAHAYGLGLGVGPPPLGIGRGNEARPWGQLIGVADDSKWQAP